MTNSTDPNISNFYTLNYDLGFNRQVQINGNLFSTQSAQEKYFSMCETVAVVERVRAKLEIPALEFKLWQMQQNLRDLPALTEKDLQPALGMLEQLQQQLEVSGKRDKAPSLHAQIDTWNKAKNEKIKQAEEKAKELEDSIAELTDRIAKQRRFVETGIEE